MTMQLLKEEVHARLSGQSVSEQLAFYKVWLLEDKGSRVSATSLHLCAVGGLGAPSSIHGEFEATARRPQQDL